MVVPKAFGSNPETASTNSFQGNGVTIDVGRRAQSEAERMADQLDRAGVDVRVFQDDPSLDLPDAVFPNNWVSTHGDDGLVLYPMLSPNRRRERRGEIIQQLVTEFGLNNIHNFAVNELSDQFLEGTGSLVLDRERKIAYAALSARTHIDLVEEWCDIYGFRAVPFFTQDRQRLPIYHTNVVMGLGHGLCAICLWSVQAGKYRDDLMESLDGLEVIDLSPQQMEAFAGNWLALQSLRGEPLGVFSSTAWYALGAHQKAKIEARMSPVVVEIPTIEKVGGGSARCMLLEIYPASSFAR
jgi:hypothetical protein